MGVHACVSAGSDWKLISFARHHGDLKPVAILQHPIQEIASVDFRFRLSTFGIIFPLSSPFLEG